jgi:hypothetical protein
MKFTLLTYQSILVHNAGYVPDHSAIEFAERLTKLADEFAEHSGIPAKDVIWQKVQSSDWCARMVVLYASVPKDWEPTSETFCLDEVYNESWFPNLVSSLQNFLEGGGKYRDIRKHPAVNPHNLFRTKTRK